MDLETYQEKIKIISKSFLGKSEFYEDFNKINLLNIPLLKAFLEDDDIQEITICSANIGLVKTYQKQYKQWSAKQ